MKNMVIQYVRKNKIPSGAIVAIKSQEGFKIGYSLCRKNEKFKKEIGLKIALGRALSWNQLPPDIPKPILKLLPYFIERCKKYYKTKYEPEIQKSLPF